MNITIKKFVTACVLSGALLGSMSAMAVEKHICINYSTTVAATYADGTPILAGERFLLVWFDKDVTIDLNTDITGDENSFLGDDWWWVSFAGANNGVCPSTKWELDKKASSDCYPQGRAQLYLLDTRISATELAPMIENDEGDNFPSVINAVVPIEKAVYSWNELDAIPHTINDGKVPITTTDWVVYRTIKTIPTPVIVSFVYTNGVATVVATNTVSSSRYALVGSLIPTFAGATWTNATLNGASTLTTPLNLSDSSATQPSAFYRIEVVK